METPYPRLLTRKIGIVITARAHAALLTLGEHHVLKDDLPGHVGDAFDAEDCDSCAEDGMLGAMAGWVATFAASSIARVASVRARSERFIFWRTLPRLW